MMAYNDAELIKRTLEGDDTAFGFLVDKYKGAVHALAYRKLGDFQIAEEITQDTFLKAYQHLGNLKDYARFPGWLYVIAARRCISWQRKKRLTTQSLEDVDETQMRSLTWSKYMDMQSRQEVHDALESLPESDRTVLTLYYLGGLTCEEIAQFIGVSRDAVKGRLYRARCRMKEEIMKTIEQDWGMIQLPPAFTQRIVEWIRPLTPKTPVSSKPLTPWIAAATLAVATLLIGLGLMQTTTYQLPYSLTNTEAEFMVELTEAPISEILTPKQSTVNRYGGANGHGIGHGNTSQGPLLALGAGTQSERKIGEIVWKQTNGPYGGFIWSLLVIPEDGTIYAGTKDSGVFRSDDGGNTWVQRNKGLDIPNVETLISVGKTIYAGTGFGGVFRSEDGGNSWKYSGLERSNIKVLTASKDGTLYASVFQKGIFRSDDGGSSWTQLDKGPIEPTSVIWSLIVAGNTLYAGSPGGSIFYSQDKGDSWTEMKSKFTAKNIYALAISGNTLYAGTAGDGIFRSQDKGNSWTQINTGLTRNVIHSIAVSGNDLYIGADGAIFHSEDGGDSWRELSTGLTDQRVLAIAAFESNLYAGTAGFGILRSNDRGQTWAQAKTGLTNQQVRTLVLWGQTLYAGAENGGVSLSEDGGMSWVSANTGLPSQSGRSLSINILKVIGNSLYAGTARGVFRMELRNNSWTPSNTGLIMSFQGHEMTPQVMSLISMGTTIYAGTFEGGVFRSEDDGKSWKQVNTGLTDKKVQALAVMETTTPEPPYPLPKGGRGVVVRGTTLYAGTWEGGVFRSKDKGDSWTQINTGLIAQLGGREMIPHVNELTVMGEVLYAGTMAGVFRSEDKGDSWTLINVGLTYKSGGKERTQPVQSLAVSGTTLYAGTGAGVFYSEDGGNSWTQISTGLKHEAVRALVVSETDLYVGTFGGGVYRASLSK
jgi:RNA polymerase sigma factor (sigma-70 family)